MKLIILSDKYVLVRHDLATNSSDFVRKVNSVNGALVVNAASFNSRYESDMNNVQRIGINSQAKRPLFFISKNVPVESTIETYENLCRELNEDFEVCDMRDKDNYMIYSKGLITWKRDGAIDKTSYKDASCYFGASYKNLKKYLF